MHVFGIAGPARSGKDTIGSFLFQEYGFCRIAFADPIKKMIAALLEVTVDQVDQENYKETVITQLGFSPRELMQTLGTEWARKTLDPYFWILMAKRTMHQARMWPAKGVVFTDVRFNNEAEMIRAEGGIIIHVERPGHDKITLGAHASEDGIHCLPTDWVVCNTHDIASLQEQVKSLFETYTRSRA